MDAFINGGTRKQDKGTIKIKTFMLGKQVYAGNFRKSFQGTKWTKQSCGQEGLSTIFVFCEI